MQHLKSVFFIFILSTVMAPASMFAQSAGAFARLGFGARGMALGNALVGDGFGEASAFYNPSLAPYVDQQNVMATHAFLSQDRTLQFFQFAVPLRPRAGVTIGLIHAGVSGIDGRDASGLHTQNYSVDELAGFLAFGTRIGGRVSAGMAFRFYYADLLPDLEPAKSLGLNIGLSVRILDNLNIGLAVDDLLARYDWDTSSISGNDGRKTSNKFPARLRIGGAYRLLDGRGLLVIEYESLIEYGQGENRTITLFGGSPNATTTQGDELRLHSGRLRFGIEYKPLNAFTLRTGIDQIGNGSSSELTPSAGFSVEQALGQLGTQFEYALRREAYGAGLMNVLSVRFNL